MDKLNPYYIEALNNNLTATGFNRKIISDVLLNEMKKSFNLTGNIDMQVIENVRKEIMDRVKEDGTPFYSPHVRDHMGEIEKAFSQFIRTRFCKKNFRTYSSKFIRE